MKKRTLSLAAMEKLLRNAGNGRVSDEAKEALCDYLEEKAIEIGAKSWKLAEHSGRRTVKASDIKLAVKG